MNRFRKLRAVDIHLEARLDTPNVDIIYRDRSIKNSRKKTYYMNTRVIIQSLVSIGSSYATPINDDMT